MKRCIGVALAIAFLSLSAPTDATAQASVFFGGGATIPVSDYGNFANVGWMGFGGVLFPVGTNGVSVGAEGFYGSNGHDTDGDKTNLAGGMALIGYAFGEEGASVSPTVFGGVGYMNHSFKSESTPQFEGSSSGLAAGVGFGVGIPVGEGGTSAFVGGSYNMGFGDVDGTDFIGISAALMIPVGGN